MPRYCNVDNMAKFIYALETGGYPQGTGALNRGGNFCCLGVACAVAIDNGVEMATDVRQDPGCYCGIDHGYGEADKRTLYDGEGGYLPEKVADWLGLEEEDGDDNAPFMTGSGNRSNPLLAGTRATVWNDEFKASFPVIAQLFRYEFLDAA